MSNIVKVTRDNNNPFAMAAPTESNVGEAMMVARASQEVQAAMVIAKKYPRNEFIAFEKISKACKRKALAEISTYQFSRGGTKIAGPSIHLLKAIATNWQNIEHGWREVSRKEGESVIEAFAWDIENNSRSSMTFTVRHWRDTKEGGHALTDSRDVYEQCANQASRRVRACLESVIPGDVVDAAVEECEKTLRSGNSEPLADRARKMAGVFGDLGVTVEMIEKKLQHKLEAISEQEMVQLRRIYTSMKDGMSKREDWFEVTQTVATPQFGNQDDGDLGPQPKPEKEPEVKQVTTSTPASDLSNAKEMFATLGTTEEAFMAWCLKNRHTTELKTLEQALIGSPTIMKRLLGKVKDNLEAIKACQPAKA